MGTSGAVGFRIGGRNIIYYNHFDSYPEGLGKKVVEFCEYLMDMQSVDENYIDKVRDNVRKVKFVDNSIPPTPKQIKMYERFIDLRVSEQNLKDWYCLLRKAQMAEGLYAMANGELQDIQDAANFIKDSLFCEYAYIIDLDNLTIELYKGFQHEPQEGNPFGTEPCRNGDYYPCRLAKVFPINEVPNNWMKICFPEDYEKKSNVQAVQLL
jgi:hypothetical protein